MILLRILARCKNLFNDYSLLGENISDEMLSTKFLMTLPPEMNYFISTWATEASRTIANLTSRLVTEEVRLYGSKHWTKAIIMRSTQEVDRHKEEANLQAKNRKGNQSRVLNAASRAIGKQSVEASG